MGNLDFWCFMPFVSPPSEALKPSSMGIGCSSRAGMRPMRREPPRKTENRNTWGKTGRIIKTPWKNHGKSMEKTGKTGMFLFSSRSMSDIIRIRIKIPVLAIISWWNEKIGHITRSQTKCLFTHWWGVSVCSLPEIRDFSPNIDVALKPKHWCRAQQFCAPQPFAANLFWSSRSPSHFACLNLYFMCRK